MRPPLLLTGGPAAGKTSTARWLALDQPRAAMIDVDDIRQLVVAGHLAPWEGQAGAEQQRIGVENACDLAQRFLAAEIAVILADVVTTNTLDIYRQLLPGLLVVRLRLSLGEARRRETLRTAYLTEAEFEDLHTGQAATNDLIDATIDVDALTLSQQVDAVAQVWPSPRLR